MKVKSLLILFLLVGAMAIPTVPTSLAISSKFTDLSYLYLVETQAHVDALPPDINALGYDIAILVEGSELDIDGFTIHDATYYGIAVDERYDVTVSNCEVYNIGDHTDSSFTPTGLQHGNAIYYWYSSGEISSNNVHDYQKSGITANYPYDSDGSVDIIENEVTGLGPVSFIAQNGIQVAYGATGSIIDNKVTGHVYTGVGYGSMGILLIGFDGGEVRGNEVSQSNTGIYLYDSDDNEVEENEVTDSTHEGIFLLAGSTSNLVKENEISDDWWGIVLNGADENTVKKNEIFDSLTGILLYDSDDNGVEENEVTADYEGIFLFVGSTGNLVKENEISDSGFGIVVNSADGNEVVKNEVSDSIYWGISAWWSSSNTFRENEASGSGYDDLYDSSAPTLTNTWLDNEGTSNF